MHMYEEPRTVSLRMVLYVSVFLVLAGCAVSPAAFKHPTVSGSPVRVGDIVSITKEDGYVVTMTVEHIARNGLEGGYGIFVANNKMQSVSIHRIRHQSVPPAPPSVAEKVSDKSHEIVDVVLRVITAPQ